MSTIVTVFGFCSVVVYRDFLVRLNLCFGMKHALNSRKFNKTVQTMCLGLWNRSFKLNSHVTKLQELLTLQTCKSLVSFKKPIYIVLIAYLNWSYLKNNIRNVFQINKFKVCLLNLSSLSYIFKNLKYCIQFPAQSWI